MRVRLPFYVVLALLTFSLAVNIIQYAALEIQDAQIAELRSLLGALR